MTFLCFLRSREELRPRALEGMRERLPVSLTYEKSVQKTVVFVDVFVRPDRVELYTDLSRNSNTQFAYLAEAHADDCAALMAC
jgi:hypothetical protein